MEETIRRGRNRRHRDWEPFDKITLEVVPRWKESENSGDEWRTNVRVVFFFKGHRVYTHSVTNMQSALMLLTATWFTQSSPINEKVLELEPDYCDQPGCSRTAGPKQWLKRIASREGWLEQTKSQLLYFRKFCPEHSRRGDCGLDDADDNYTNQIPPVTD
jgi:hypothetical protein